MFFQIKVCHVQTKHDESSSKPVHHEISIDIKSGVVVSCFLDEYVDREPQLGRVTEDSGTNSWELEVKWMVGVYTKPWKLHGSKEWDKLEKRKYH